MYTRRAKMEKIQNVLMKYLMPIANKLEQQKHIQAIKDGIVASIPIIIVGSFCTIFLGIANLLGSGPVYDFLSANMGVLTYASAFTNDMLAVYATYFIAKTLSEKYDLKGSQPAVTALVVFFILCAVVKDGQLSTSYLGSTGLFTGIVAALFTVEIYHICYERKWYIKKSAENGWSRNVLVHQIESNLYQRQVQADKVTNLITAYCLRKVNLRCRQ